MRKILVIDDEKPTLSMFRLFLGAYGYTVLTAENGKEGLELFMKEKPPIVLTDIKMPGMDGFEVLKRIKKADASAEVIVITGHGDMDLAIKALDFNATDFIKKPIQKAALDAALKRAEERLKRAKEKEGNEVSFERVEDIAIMEIAGDLTSFSEAVLLDAYETLSVEGSHRIVMQFEENCSITGAGINLLIRILSESKKRNQMVVISGLSENYKEILEIVGITRLAQIYALKKDAIKALT
jgi:YesN/AraC family two-component response regulator